jgi:hypothetical protein
MEKREQLSRVESRLMNQSRMLAQQIISDAIADIIVAHDFGPTASVELKDGKFFIVEQLADAKD